MRACVCACVRLSVTFFGVYVSCFIFILFFIEKEVIVVCLVLLLFSSLKKKFNGPLISELSLGKDVMKGFYSSFFLFFFPPFNFFAFFSFF